MSDVNIIQGPAYVLHNGYAFYTKGNVVISYKTEVWNPRVAIGGDMGERVKSRMAEITFTPAGMVTAATVSKYWPYNGADIGKAIFGAVNASLTCAICPLSGNKITFARSAITKVPAMKLSTTETLWGSMTITALGDPTKAPTSLTYYQAIAATSADTSFDETTVISPRYRVTYGSIFNGCETDENGFEVELLVDLKPMALANYGTREMVIESMATRAKFKPITVTSANIPAYHTEAELVDSIQLESATPLLPGDVISPLPGVDLVFSGTGLMVTLYSMGPKEVDLVYGPGEWRQGDIAFVNRRIWTAGVVNNFWNAT